MTKSLLLFAICLVIVTQAAILSQADPYEKFSSQNGKDYKGNEKQMHREIFNENLAKINELNKQGQKLAVNNFTDWTQSQLLAFNTYRPYNNELLLASVPKTMVNITNFTAPASFDWRKLGRVTPVKNQTNQCGSCWAFSSTAQYESLLAIQTNGTFYDLSEQYGMECENRSFGCDGGYPSQALYLYNQTGIPLETYFPYNPKNDHYYKDLGKPICTQLPRVKLQENPIEIGININVTAENLIYEVTTYGPVTVGLKASQVSFFATKDGLISCEQSSPLDHAVLLVGYNSSHWFIKNSWGVNWGDQGYAYINRSADCGILSIVNYFRMPSPSANKDTTLIIGLTDKYGDGWEGTSIALKQNNKSVFVFGREFTSGFKYGPIKAKVAGNESIQVVLNTVGSYSNQVGFLITDQNGTILFTRQPGTVLKQPKLGQFCPKSCPTPPPATKTYSITLGDTKGDGWNGNEISLRQNGKAIKILTMASGKTAGPINIQLDRFVKVEVVATKLGLNSNEVQLTIKTLEGNIVFNRPGNSTFIANEILGSWIPDGTNESLKADSSSPQRKYTQLFYYFSFKNNILLRSQIINQFVDGELSWR